MFESLDDREKTAFTLILMRYVGNLEKGLRLRESGLIDEETLDSVGRNLVACMKAPGGAQWWKIVGPQVSPILSTLARKFDDVFSVPVRQPGGGLARRHRAW